MKFDTRLEDNERERLEFMQHIMGQNFNVEVNVQGIEEHEEPNIENQRDEEEVEMTSELTESPKGSDEEEEKKDKITIRCSGRRLQPTNRFIETSSQYENAALKKRRTNFPDPIFAMNVGSDYVNDTIMIRSSNDLFDASHEKLKKA